jgi:hypothetical protein
MALTKKNGNNTSGSTCHGIRCGSDTQVRWRKGSHHASQRWLFRDEKMVRKSIERETKGL